MFLYRIRFLNLVKKLCAEHGQMTRPFFADNLTLVERVKVITVALKTVLKYGPGLRYFTAGAELTEAATRVAMKAEALKFSECGGTATPEVLPAPTKQKETG